MAIEQSFPICAICNKPVDELTTAENPIDRAFVITASCHGDTETVTIPWTKLAEADRVSFGGQAFANKPHRVPARAMNDLRETELHRAEAIAADRLKIMGSVRMFPPNALSFTALPLRWFDDWTREAPFTLDNGFRWDSGRESDPIEDLKISHEYHWRRKTPEEFGRMQQELYGTFPFRSPQETEALRAWATYLLQTELFDRSGPHRICHGEAVPGGPHAHVAARYASQARETTEATCKRLVGQDRSKHLRREAYEYVRNATRNGDDAVKALERYLEDLPPLTSTEDDPTWRP